MGRYSDYAHFTDENNWGPSRLSKVTQGTAGLEWQPRQPRLQGLALTIALITSQKKKNKNKNKPVHSSLHYPASKKWNLVGTEDTSLMSENCVGNKNALGWKSVDLGRDFKQITFPLWMSVGPSIKGLVWTRTSHWNRTALIVYGSLKWALFLPEETMKSLEMWAEVADRPFTEEPKHV